MRARGVGVFAAPSIRGWASRHGVTIFDAVYKIDSRQSVS